jgi:hypothetical protein
VYESSWVWTAFMSADYNAFHLALPIQSSLRGISALVQSGTLECKMFVA